MKRNLRINPNQINILTDFFYISTSFISFIMLIHHMSLKVNLLHLYVKYFPENHGTYSEEQEKDSIRIL